MQQVLLYVYVALQNLFLDYWLTIRTFPSPSVRPSLFREAEAGGAGSGTAGHDPTEVLGQRLLDV
jgi:hypothetical protein